MNINFLDPVLTRLLDLLTSCGWADMASDDMCAIAERANCDFANGASKGCFMHPSWDYVLKVPLYADEDIEENYCQREYEAYQTILNNYPDCASLFAPIKFIGWYGEMAVYAQEKIYRTYEQCRWANVQTQKWRESLNNEAYSFVHSSKTKDAKRIDWEYHAIVTYSRLSLPFFYFIFKTFGSAVCEALVKWIKETDQDDLHEANVGITADFKPIIFDYSGFDG